MKEDFKIEGDLDVEEEKRASFYLFGRDMMKIPCFRTTFLYSLSSWVGVGLITFLATSKPQLSSHVGFASFVAVTLGYYTKCRSDYHNERVQMLQLQQALKRAAMEGSRIDEA